MKTYKIEIERSKGYNGKLAANHEGWVARITGTDEQYGMARTFLKGTPSSNAPYHKPKCVWQDAYALPEGLYEKLESGERVFFVVRYSDDGSLVSGLVKADRALRIAELMDDGIPFEEARIATKPVVAA